MSISEALPFICGRVRMADVALFVSDGNDW